ncbi:hypothetical protein BofuT4_uP054810.1 [Botrytis cinerea T4]|uniref:Uncharacterized protein n=1 Tax=Botryotinia fuckeliana (strain T4) TaxID=999810 RepID=G2XVR0_BOTF4|nr:hypothetical protein BofuT4_uP054810.1 [Botrytis cinerea T4]
MVALCWKIVLSKLINRPGGLRMLDFMFSVKAHQMLTCCSIYVKAKRFCFLFISQLRHGSISTP